jgi:beta-1,4-N-acetylglucosaminyltransferase
MCVIVALAVNAMRLLSLGLVPEMTIVYVESVARVKSLSLSGKIMRYLADQFVVQWPDLLTVDLERRFGAKCALVV